MIHQLHGDRTESVHDNFVSERNITRVVIRSDNINAVNNNPEMAPSQMDVVQDQPIHRPDVNMFIDHSLNEKLEDLLSDYEEEVWFIINFIRP